MSWNGAKAAVKLVTPDRKLLLPALFLTVGALATLVGYSFAHRTIDQYAERQLAVEVGNLIGRFDDRITAYEEVVSGAVALLDAKGPDNVRRSDWRAYSRAVNFATKYPALDTLGYAVALEPAQLEQYVDGIRSDGWDSFNVWPDSQGNESAPVKFIAPLDIQQQRLFGFDMLSDPVRRAALSKAAITSSFAASGTVRAVGQEQPSKQSSVLIVHPVHESTLPDYSDLHGYVYAEVSIANLIESLLGTKRQQFAVAIHGVDPSSNTNLNYNSESEIATGEEAHSSRYSTSAPIRFVDKQWTIVMRTKPDFEQNFHKSVAYLVAVGGGFLTLLGSVLAFRLSSSLSQLQRRKTQLHQQQSFSRHLLENLNLGVVACNEEGEISIINRVARDWHAIDLRVTPKHEWGEYFTYLDENHLPLSNSEVPLVRANRGEIICDEDTYLTSNRSSLRTLLVSASPLYDEDSGKIGAVLMMQDVTARRKTEADLVAQQNFWRKVLDASPNHIIALDTAGRVVLINQAAAKHFGVSVDTAIGLPATILHSEENEAYLFLDAVNQVLASKEITVVQEEPRTSQAGERAWFNAIRVPITSYDDNEALVLCVFTDISEQREAANQVRQLNESLETNVRKRTENLEALNRSLEKARQDADAANLAKSTFLASMSHEIRTPMNGVVGMIDILMGSNLDDDQASVLSTINESANALLRIIDDVLDFSKIEAGEFELEAVATDVCHLTQSVCTSLGPIAEQKNVDLVFSADHDVPQQFEADGTRLRQIVLNLVGNAIKFSAPEKDQRGRVDVTLSMEKNGELNLTVSDNGIGMSKTAQSKLFGEFQQADATTTRRFGGTGLGLAITKRLVKLMGGSITVNSEQNIGSQFCVTLMLPVVADAEALDDLAGLHCVLVPGEFVSTAWLRRQLEAGGAEISEAASLESATSLQASASNPVVIVAQCFSRGDEALQQFNALAKREAKGPLLIISWDSPMDGTPVDTAATVCPGQILDAKKLLRYVSVTAGRSQPKEQQSYFAEFTAPRLRAPSVADARRSGHLILVAEDDETNQKVILRQLSILGYAAEVAKNGLEALEMWRANDYLMVLSDIHMPEIDGYGLIDCIRTEQRSDSPAKVIALSANAVRGEAERALRHGFDAYVTKPVRLDELSKTLSETLFASDEEDESAALKSDMSELSDSQADDTIAIDYSVVIELLAGDEFMIREVLEDFLSTSKDISSNLKTTVDTKNTKKAAELAHRLKSSSRTIGASALGDLCADLENYARMGDVDQTCTACNIVVEELHKAQSDIEQRLQANDFMQEGSIA